MKIPIQVWSEETPDSICKRYENNEWDGDLMSNSVRWSNGIPYIVEVI